MSAPYPAASSHMLCSYSQDLGNQLFTGQSRTSSRKTSTFVTFLLGLESWKGQVLEAKKMEKDSKKKVLGFTEKSPQHQHF